MFIDDFARGIVAMGARDDAFGDAWILPHAPAITGREFIKLTFEQTGKPMKQGTLSRGMVRLGGLFSPLIREFGEMVYQFEQPFVVDSSRFERTFGLSTTPYRDGIAETLDWVRRGT
jgi:nucleoside-diphosphate-sugar epimerase